MSKFEDFFDDFMIRAKSVAGSASKKTGEVVDMSKIKYQQKQLQWDIEKTFAKLGAIVYESKKSTENFTEVIDLAISELDSLQEKLEDLEGKLRDYKNVNKCPNCGRENDKSYAYCSRCGEKIEVEEPEQPVAEPEFVIVEEEIPPSEAPTEE